MHKINDLAGGDARQALARQKPFGAGVADSSIVSRTERVEVWGSGINDPGDDFCEFRAFDAAGARIGTFRVAGY